MYNLVSPWPPQRNGIADYAYELARHANEPVIVATRAIGARPCAEHVVLIDDLSFSRDVARKGAPTLYHFGNNPDHAFMVPLFLEWPGVAVVHEFSLQYLAEKVDALLPGFLDQQLEAEHPRTAQRLKRLWRLEGMKRALDYREIALLGWLGAARAVIVHSHYAARIVAGYLPGQRIHVVPHFAYPARASFAGLQRLRYQARARLGIEADALVLSTLGFATRNKQYRAVFDALTRIRVPAGRTLRFLVAGELRPHEYDLEADLRESGAQPFVRLLGYVPEANIRDVLLASDLVVNLRFPSYGESSGSLARALALGCAALVSDQGSYGELPDAAAIKIPARQDASRDIQAVIESLLEEPGALGARRAAAYEYAHTALSPVLAARRYSEIVHAA
jgi:glycosyltransferase involved in cell wall biosynthesis